MKTNGARGSSDAAGATQVVLGVDTHLEFHVAVALDHLGRRLGEAKAPTTAKGYGQLVRWARGFGPVRRAGVEGTGSYGAGLARYLKAAGIAVVEVERPKRRHLRRRGKSDPIDAERAARAVLSGEAAGVPRSGDGRVEMIRALRGARRSAVKARMQAANQIQAMLVTAPGPCANVCAGSPRGSWSPSRPASDPTGSPKTWRWPRGSPCARSPAATERSRRR